MSFLALRAYLAAKAAGRGKEILFVGIDALPQEGQAYVSQGILAASFEYPTGGAEAVRVALDILNKKMVPKNIELPSRVFESKDLSGSSPMSVADQPTSGGL